MVWEWINKREFCVFRPVFELPPTSLIRISQVDPVQYLAH